MKKIVTIVVIAVMLQLAVVSLASAAPPADGPQGYHHTNCGYGYNNYYCNNYRYQPVYKYRYTTYRYYYHPPVYNNCYSYRCYPTYKRVYYTPRCFNCNYAYYW